MLETTVPLNHSTEDESVSDDALELDLGGTTQSVFREMSHKRHQMMNCSLLLRLAQKNK